MNESNTIDHSAPVANDDPRLRAFLERLEREFEDTEAFVDRFQPSPAYAA